MDLHIDVLDSNTRQCDIRRLIELLSLRFRQTQGIPCFNAAVLHSFASLFGKVTMEEVQARITAMQESRDALARLLNRPSIPQRTPAWYEARNGMITASDFAQALGEGKFGSQKQLLWKKCLPQSDDAFAALANCPPIKWGTMYEDVAQMLYSKRYGLVVHEFGLVQHPEIKYLGASPDGVTEMGVMLEIKCPYRRQITGDIPLQYFYQIQGQLEVCGLTECDFLEVGLEELCRDDFLACSDDVERGIVVEYLDATSVTPENPYPKTSHYGYSGVDWPMAALVAYEESIIASHSQSLNTPVRMHYWRVKTWSCVRVTKDPAFVETMLNGLQTIWSRIEMYRQDPSLLEAEVGLPPAGGAEQRSRPRKEETYAFREPQQAARSSDLPTM